MTLPADWRRRLPLALHPVAQPPAGPGWNRADLVDLLPEGEPSPAAVLVGIVERAAGPAVLLTRRHAGLRHHAGQISFPGGRIEAADGSPAVAALREAAEEIGLARALAEPLGFLDPFVTITGFHVFPLVAAVDPRFVAVPDPGEVEEAFEVPLAFLLDPASARPFEVDFQGRRRRIVEMVYGPHRIWGATAAMLVNLRERLEGVP